MNILSNIIKKHPLKIIIFGLLYIASPIDFVPDLSFPFGLLDDVTVLGILMNAVRELVTRKNSSNHPTPKDDSNVIDIESEKID